MMTDTRVDTDRRETPGRGASLGEAGVTLIEVLIAIVVLAVGLLGVAAMTGAVAMQTRMAGTVAGQTAAGQEVLESLQMKGYDHPDLAAGSTGADTVEVNNWSYPASYRVTQETTNLKRVTVVVQGTRDLPPDTMWTLVSGMNTTPPSIP